MVTSIRNFARELGSSHVIRGHAERRRANTMSRSAASESEFEELKASILIRKHHGHHQHPQRSMPKDLSNRTMDFDVEKARNPPRRHHHQHHNKGSLRMKRLRRVGSREPTILMLKEEKDRFDTMRSIQHGTSKFKRYYALTMSVLACKPPFPVPYPFRPPVPSFLIQPL